MNIISTKEGKEKKFPLISVVMPVYNMSPYAGEAIESILNQTFTNFEFIIVDDASTDNTWNIIRSYKDKRVIAVQNKTNLGNYPSRNIGMRLAKGKYIAVMDSDDIAMPERLEKQHLHLEKNPDLVALGSDFEITPEEKKNDIPLTHEDICFCLLRKFGLLHPSLMIKTDIIQSLNGYNEEYKYASDYNLFCRLTLAGEMENLPDVLMKYRRHEKQISQSNRKEQDEYAKNIRRKYQVAFINKYKSNTQDAASLAEVSIPEIGMAICYYTYASSTNHSGYKELADKTIDVIYKVTTKDMPVCMENGLCGLGCGFQYLINNKFLAGDTDEVLEDIDAKVIKTLLQPSGKAKEQIKDLLLYIDYRISKSNKVNSEKIHLLSSVYADFTKKYTNNNQDESE